MEKGGDEEKGEEKGKSGAGEVAQLTARIEELEARLATAETDKAEALLASKTAHDKECGELQDQVRALELALSQQKERGFLAASAAFLCLAASSFASVTSSSSFCSLRAALGDFFGRVLAGGAAFSFASLLLLLLLS